MSVVPVKQVEKIQWYEDRLTQWTAQAVPIGSTAPVVADLATKTSAARAAFDAQQLIFAQAKAKTLTLNLAVSAMGVAGAGILRQIRAKADIAGGSIYVLAQVPPPAIPTPVPPPGMPTDFTAALNPVGSLKLNWKCANPAGSQGTTYQVFRRIGSASTGAGGAFTFIGSSGVRSLTDDTLPAGAAVLTYRIVAVRSTSMGTAALFLVNIGVGGTGEMTASVAESPRLAA